MFVRPGRSFDTGVAQSMQPTSSHAGMKHVLMLNEPDQYRRHKALVEYLVEGRAHGLLAPVVWIAYAE